MGSALSSSLPSINSAYRSVYERFVDDASFLWVLRSVALNQPHYQLMDLHELENRINANLDGLFTAPEIAWALCEDALEFEEPGEVFTSAIFAFRSLEADKIQKVVEVGLSNSEATKGLVSALAWLPDEITSMWIEKFIRSKDLHHKQLAIACMGAKRKDPGEYLLALLQREDCTAHEMLHARMIRLIGEIARLDLVPAVNAAMESSSDEVKFWALWSAALLGNKAIYPQLEAFVVEPNSKQDIAAAIYFRCAPTDQSKKLISELSKDELSKRIILKACAALGDPQVIPWVIQQMENSAYARVAGETFTQITGIYLEENNLDIEVPDVFLETDMQPNDDAEDESVALDEDENLPWPDVNKIKYIWQKYSGKYQQGTRYLAGRVISRDTLLETVRTGYQRQRRAAALELALSDPALPLININSKVEV